MNIREKREAVFLLLYQASVNVSENSGETAFEEIFEQILDGDKEAFGLEADGIDLGLIADKARRVTENIPNADAIIEKYSKTRKISRIAKICLAIMRLALYEMDFDPDVPEKAAINEAVNLCRKYADDKDRSFINGVLGSYYKDKHQ